MASASIDFRNTNTVWSSVMVESLVRLGLRQAVVSPGSRSTPLTMALVRHSAVETIPALDERSAGFFALGLARRAGKPVVLVCTSGSAGAHLYPAIIEASESGVPLIVLTADRPPELRECHSGQTIDQQKLYGDHVRWYHELAVPEPALDLLRCVRQQMAHGWSRASGPFPGPVHLNVPFRDPLAPLPDGRVRELEGRIDDLFFEHLGTAVCAGSEVVTRFRTATSRGLIVAGPAAPFNAAVYAAAAGRLAAATGWPVLADTLSSLRTESLDTNAPIVSSYDAILRNERVSRLLAPRQILCLGGWPTSKVLRAYLEASQADVLLVSPTERNRDSLHARTRQIAAPVESLVPEGAAPGDDAYASLWRRAEAVARSALDAGLKDCGQFEGKAAWLLAQVLPENTPVFVAGSMPVRDVEYFWPVNHRRPQFAFNRGANGIDGTLSSALGMAHGGRPSVLLTGDLALLHDTNGGLLLNRFRGSLTIVLINNRGGGIFEHLPIAAFNPPFEDYFATPQLVDFSRWAATYGIEHTLVGDWNAFERAVGALPASGVRLLEVRTDRKSDAAFRKALFAQVAARVGEAIAT
ncbi:MAG: 2-succinyl-5-enolpyruvyl-6-hydroxy-3-cyclohexene-1-carboxylic-acid synthase [Opitutaceae bacterium]|nr:2-succinyl-5-enolpyruvyl-6-hydroxy-3-cyclohexene-1-carboxylic-acid synthase [Opitutaceae bacterium]